MTETPKPGDTVTIVLRSDGFSRTSVVDESGSYVGCRAVDQGRAHIVRVTTPDADNTPSRYTAARIGYAFWAVVTPSGSTEDTLTGPDAENKVRALVAERNSELDEDVQYPLGRRIVAGLLGVSLKPESRKP